MRGLSFRKLGKNLKDAMAAEIKATKENKRRGTTWLGIAFGLNILGRKNVKNSIAKGMAESGATMLPPKSFATSGKLVNGKQSSKAPHRILFNKSVVLLVFINFGQSPEINENYSNHNSDYHATECHHSLII